ncbi:DUF4062 domain-containing protein [Spirillospora sp. NPDC127200]
MRIFISSVRRGLELERDHLRSLLKVTGFEPIAFEDFTAQNAPSRTAVISAAESADAVILLLGEIYGDPLPDSGVATTEEEFITARRKGLPLLVFRKANMCPEPKQREFIRRVGEYVHGRFWREFSDHADLGIAVVAALRELREQSTPLSWTPLTAPTALLWRQDRRHSSDTSNSNSNSLLEVHLAATSERKVIPVSALSAIEHRVVRVAREEGFFQESASVNTGSDVNFTWATTMIEDQRRSYSIDQIWHGGMKGISVDRTGSVLVFTPLPRDMIGSLIDSTSLTSQAAGMLRLAAQLIPAEVDLVIPAAAIDPLGNTREGDPQNLGRNGGPMRLSDREAPLRTEPEGAVPVKAFPEASTEVARELAAHLLAHLRERNPW